MKLKRITICVALAVAPGAFAEEMAAMPEVQVTAEKLQPLPSPSNSGLDQKSLSGKRTSTSDSASLLSDVPGVSLYGAGGVSSLPVIHGMADDRVRTTVDGMDLISACPNHMNSPLSYIDPTNVGSIKVVAGITPVSMGGDSIGGTIQVDSAVPEFAAAGQGTLLKGQAGAFYRSNGNANGGNISVTLASEMLSMTYSGSMARSDNYTAGGDFKTFTATGRAGHDLPLDEVGSTAYKSENQTLGFALKNDNDLFEVKFGFQDIPYELYPTQRMDMLGNNEHSINLRYLGQRDWGTLEARAYHQNVDHYMDFGADKKLNYGTIAGTSGTVYSVDGMPMYTASKTDGALIKADIALTRQDLLRVGGEVQQYRLDDWWPPSPNCGTDCSGGMAPYTFWNINGGKRDRTALFAEWEAQKSDEWATQLGARYEQVKTDTGQVQGYNTTAMYTSSSVGTTDQFNNMDRKRTDNNLDLTALGRYTPDTSRTFEFGFAQKTRSPNLYERYDWSKNGMALEMNNFVGDGNGYLGNPDLKPEVAHTLSITGDWHSADRDTELRVTPYYTRVSDYVDAIRIPGASNISMYVNGVLSSVPNATLTNGFVKLQYANQSARLYGIDVSGKLPLGKTAWGDWGMRGVLNYTNGKNLDTSDGLYNIMPLNARITFTQQTGGWDNGIEVVGVKAKNDVSAVRNEMHTPGYGLVNLHASYFWKQASVNFGIENLFDKLYYSPLGGAYSGGQGATMSFDREVGTIGTSGGTATLWGVPVPGMGRSINVGVTVKF